MKKPIAAEAALGEADEAVAVHGEAEASAVAVSEAAASEAVEPRRGGNRVKKQHIKILSL